MRSTQFCSIEELENMIRVAKNSNYTHFRIVPKGSFAGFQFAGNGTGYYVPSVEDRSITRDDCVRYFCAKITWDEYMEIRQKATKAFIDGTYEEE